MGGGQVQRQVKADGNGVGMRRPAGVLLGQNVQPLSQLGDLVGREAWSDAAVDHDRVGRGGGDQSGGAPADPAPTIAGRRVEIEP